jgi:ABC-type transporter Mla subunit MlaD
MSSYQLGDLWDQQSLQKHLDFEQERIQSLSDFLKNLAALEEAYSQGLQKLVKINTKVDGAGFYTSRSVFVQGVDSLMHGVEDIADLHGRLAETLQKVRKNLKSQVGTFNQSATKQVRYYS